MATKEAIKFENFKLDKESSENVNAGIIILASGLLLFFFPLLNILTIFSNSRGFEPSYYPTTFGELSRVMGAIFFYYSFAVLDNFSIITSAVTGWAVGGFIAAILYGNEGKSGPLYATYILLRFCVGLLTVLIVAIPLVGSYEIAVPTVVPFFGLLLLVSLPMIIVSSITYRVGLWISPK